MLALRRSAVFAGAHKHAVSSTLSAPLSSSTSDQQQQPKSMNKHKARDNRQRVAEGALHAAKPALKHAADLYTKKGRASEGAYFVHVCLCHFIMLSGAMDQLSCDLHLMWAFIAVFGDVENDSKKDRDALRKLVKKWSDQDDADKSSPNKDHHTPTMKKVAPDDASHFE